MYYGTQQREGGACLLKLDRWNPGFLAQAVCMVQPMLTPLKSGVVYMKPLYKGHALLACQDKSEAWWATLFVHLPVAPTCLTSSSSRIGTRWGAAALMKWWQAASSCRTGHMIL